MADPTTLNRLYGRRSGHKLRRGQAALVEELLPQIAVPDGPLDAQLLFGDDRPLGFEIGFGAGEHLAAQAVTHPDYGFIGCEPFLNGIVGALGTAVVYSPLLGGPGAEDYDIVEKLFVQAQAVGATIVWATVGTVIAMVIAKALTGGRVTPEVEQEGLDLGEHGERAYNP